MILYSSFNSKLLVSPLRQIRKVFPLVGLSGVVRPVIAPSSTLQNAGLPSQPSRVLPSKIETNPSSSARTSGSGSHNVSRKQISPNRRIVIALQGNKSEPKEDRKSRSLKASLHAPAGRWE